MIYQFVSKPQQYTGVQFTGENQEELKDFVRPLRGKIQCTETRTLVHLGDGSFLVPVLKKGDYILNIKNEVVLVRHDELESQYEIAGDNGIQIEPIGKEDKYYKEAKRFAKTLDLNKIFRESMVEKVFTTTEPWKYIKEGTSTKAGTSYRQIECVCWTQAALGSPAPTKESFSSFPAGTVWEIKI